MFGFSANPASLASADAFRHACGRALLAAAMVWALLPGRAEAEWGGGVAASVSDTRSDTTQFTIVDQNYDVFLTGRSLSRLQYFGALRYRRVGAESKGAPSATQEELQPSADLAWSSRAASVRSGYVYRLVRNRPVGESTAGQTASLAAQTNNARGPQAHGRYEWAQNVQDVELQGRDTRMATLGLGTRYYLRRLSASYDFVNIHTSNENTGLERRSVEHTGRFDGNFQLIQKLLSFQSSYLIADRVEREVSASATVTLLNVPAVAGLYAVDPTPEFGGMDALPGLIDNELTLPASFTINLSSAEVHNFGLDFGAPSTVDRLYLYTDTLANPGLRWAVFVSSDSTSWQMIRSFAPARFDIFFNRYEIGFSTQTTRFIKLVNEPLLENTDVQPTELRALAAREGDRDPAHSTDHRGAAELGLTPARWLSARAGVDVTRNESSFTRQAREQDGLYGSVRIHPAAWADLNGRYTLARAYAPDGDRQRLETEQLGATWQARWLETLLTRASLTRATERLAGVSQRENDAAVLWAETRWLPGLAGVSEIGYIEDEHLLIGDVVTTRFVGQSVEAQPTPPSTVRVEYRYYDLDARITRVPAFRRNVSVRATYRFTPLLFFSGDASVYDEPNRLNRAYNGLVSWTPTAKWGFSGSVARNEGTGQTGATLWAANAIFRWSHRTEINFGYSHTSYDEALRPGITSARLGFSTRF